MSKCDCMKKVEANLRNLLNDPEKKPSNQTLEAARCQNMSLMLDSGRFELFIPFEAKWHRQTKGGVEKVVTKTIPIFASHCPFCGKSKDNAHAKLVDDSKAPEDAWIPVTKELPDEDITVLITNNLWGDPVWLGYLDSGCWHDVDGNDLLGINLRGDPNDSVAPPTHWMPLPELPETEEIPS